jgi:glyoxylase-like metal-dependent hydrolase (beta-lactamase superfamily II)
VIATTNIETTVAGATVSYDTVQIWSIEGNTQRLDGGAMFGNAPRALWSRWAAPDERNRIRLACRAMLVREDGGRHVLFEAGIGAFMEPKLRERYGVLEDEHVLLTSLEACGVRPADVDVVVLSHLHFDHAGGVLAPYAKGVAPALAFPRATFVVGKTAWERARLPHARDKASFIAELPALLEASGRLEVAQTAASATLGPGYGFTFSDGHTPGLMITRVADGPRGPVTYVADLIPGAAWVHLPITMGYDRYPELLVDEKHALLQRVVADQGWLFFTHDPEVAACTVVHRDERYAPDERVARVAWAS